MAKRKNGKGNNIKSGKKNNENKKKTICDLEEYSNTPLCLFSKVQRFPRQIDLGYLKGEYANFNPCVPVGMAKQPCGTYPNEGF